MSILAQYLFGSHARRDFSADSDLDLLSITDEDRFGTFSEGSLSVSFYPKDRFLRAAAQGDLFVMHIVREAVLVYNTNDFHNILIRKFVYKSNYYNEIRRASDLGWFLLHYSHQIKDPHILNRRIAWCVRTILVALTAEAGDPVFSAEKLSAFSKDRHVSVLLSGKNVKSFNKNLLSYFRMFMGKFGNPDGKYLSRATIREYWYYFRNDNNAIALKVIDGMIDSVSKDIYMEDV